MQAYVADHIWHVVMHGVIQPLLLQTGLPHAAASVAAVTGVITGLCLRNHMALPVVAARTAAAWLVGLAAAGLSDRRLRRMFARRAVAQAAFAAGR